MYYGGGQEDAYSNATLLYIGSFSLGPVFLAIGLLLLIAAIKKKAHKKLLYALSIVALLISLGFGYIYLQGKPRCCGEGITYNTSLVTKVS